MRQILACSVLCLLVAAAGCGGSGATGGVPVYEVSGTVTMAGAPLGDAVVSFAPLDGQPTATGRTKEDGTFFLTTYSYGDGAAEGKFKVLVAKTILANTSSGGGDDEGHGDDEDANMDHAGGGAGAGEAQMVPPNYNDKDQTPLSAEVKKDGENNFDLVIQ